MRKIYFLTILAVLFGTASAMANTATKEEGTWDSNRAWTGNHANFEIAGENSKHNNHLDITANADQTISWTVDEGYTINVTELKMKIGHNGWFVNNCDIYLNGEKKETVGTTTDTKVTYSGYSLGNDGHFVLKTTRQVDVYWITITYTITPNEKPAQTSTEETINVTVSSANKQTIDLTKIFTVTAAHAAESQVFAFTENPDNKGVIENGLFYATAAGTYKVKSQIAAKENCHEATAWTDELTITVNHLDDALAWKDEAAIHTNMVLGTEQTITALATSNRKPTYVSDNSEVLEVDANGVLTAKALGTATITASLEGDAQYNQPESISKTFTVRKKETPHFQPVGFTEENSTLELHQNASIVLTNIDADFAYEVSEGGVVSVTRDADTLRIEALSLGEATITLTQPGSTVLNELEKAYKLTITKITPDFTVLVNGAAQNVIDLNPTQTATIAASSSNSDGEITIELVSGESAKFAEGIIEALSQTGASVVRATLAETEEYKGFSADVTVNVAYAAEEADYVLEELPDHGINSSDSRSYDLSGAGDILTIEVWKVTAATYGLALYGYDANNNETKIIEYSNGALTTEPVLKTIKISPDFVKIKVQSTGGTLNKKFQNLRVTRKVHLNVSAADIATCPEEEGKSTLAIDYSLGTCGDFKIACDNSDFVFDSYSVSGVDKKSGTANVGITFAPQTEEGTYTANITLYNRVYRKELTLTAKVTKIQPEISWNIAEMTYLEEQNLAATVNAELELNYEVTEGEAIVIEEGKLKAVKAGEAKVRVFTEATTKYNEAELVLDIKVNKAAQTINWEAIKDTIDMDEVLILAATATCSEAVTFESSDNTIAEVNAENRLVINGTGTITITAKQAGTDNYLEAEEVRTLVIVNPEIVTPPADENKKDQVLTFFKWLAEVVQGWFDDIFSPLLEGDENYVVASSNKPLTFESSNPEIVNVVTDEDGTVRLQALQEGEATITITQEGDDEYNPVVMSRKITVKPKSTPTGCDNVEDGNKAAKILRNGQILIIRDGKVYTVSGMRVE